MKTVTTLEDHLGNQVQILSGGLSYDMTRTPCLRIIAAGPDPELHFKSSADVEAFIRWLVANLEHEFPESDTAGGES